MKFAYLKGVYLTLSRLLFFFTIPCSSSDLRRTVNFGIPETLAVQNYRLLLARTVLCSLTTVSVAIRPTPVPYAFPLSYLILV